MFSTERKVEAYVRLLHSELDTTTVTAALTLLISEVRAASEKQRRLIALERLTSATIPTAWTSCRRSRRRRPT